MPLYLHNRNDGKFESVVFADDPKVIVSEPETDQYRVKEIRLDSSKKTIIVYEIGFCDGGAFSEIPIFDLDCGGFTESQPMTIDLGAFS